MVKVWCGLVFIICWFVACAVVGDGFARVENAINHQTEALMSETCEVE